MITSDSQLDKVVGVTGNDIGLMLLTDRNTIHTVREPMSIKRTVHPPVIFDSLRKNEYEQIIKEYFGAVPKVSNARMYQSCRELFCSLSPTIAHDAMVRVIKKRGSIKRLRDFIVSVPESLTAFSLSSKLGVAEQTRFLQLLNTEIGNCLVG